MLTNSDHDKLIELMRLHDEAFRHYSEDEAHHKRSEGYVELRLTNVFEREEGAAPLTIKSVGVYSYALGPHRMHDFDSLDEALAEVRKWHAQEMAHHAGSEG